MHSIVRVYQSLSNANLVFHPIFELFQPFLCAHFVHRVIFGSVVAENTKNLSSIMSGGSKGDRDNVVDLAKYTDQRVRVKFQVILASQLEWLRWRLLKNKAETCLTNVLDDVVYLVFLHFFDRVVAK